MTDPLAQVVALLRPRASYSKRVGCAGRWSARRPEPGDPYYCAILEGTCRLSEDERGAVTLKEGDFVLVPSGHNFELSSLTPPEAKDAARSPVKLADGEFRHGDPDLPPDVRLLVGHCVFRSPDAALLASLLPRLVHVRGEKRLATLVQLVSEEAREQRPAREVILERLLEVLLIEALRSSEGPAASQGLLRGLADERLATAIRQIHKNPANPWTVAHLASEAALSRSAFFARFRRALGVAPMEYLLAWRMALAKDLLRRKEGGIAEIAQRVGYSSASTFSIAFSRHVGLPPTHYAREVIAAISHAGTMNGSVGSPLSA